MRSKAGGRQPLHPPLTCGARGRTPPSTRNARYLVRGLRPLQALKQPSTTLSAPTRTLRCLVALSLQALREFTATLSALIWTLRCLDPLFSAGAAAGAAARGVPVLQRPAPRPDPRRPPHPRSALPRARRFCPPRLFVCFVCPAPSGLLSPISLPVASTPSQLPAPPPHFRISISSFARPAGERFRMRR